MSGRVVWSSGKGRICPTCGWPADDCRCSKKLDQPVPAKVTAKLRLEMPIDKLAALRDALAAIHER